MANSIGNINTIVGVPSIYFPYDVAASTHIYQGTCTMFNSSGYLIPADDASAGIFAGQARSESDNSAGADGDTQADVVPPPNLGLILLAATAPDVTWLGKLAYFVDDHTVVLSADSNNLNVAGRVVSVQDAGHVVVDPEDRSDFGTN